MNYEHFGILLKELRLNHNMSREKLAENICTTKQIYRIEKGASEPSVHLLHQLSILFNMDLNAYYKMYFNKHSLIGFEGTEAINSALKDGNTILLRSLVKQYEDFEIFKTGELLQCIYYAKALCSALLDEDYYVSLDYCLKGIKIECSDFCLDNISYHLYSNVGVGILNCISQNYFALEEYTTGMKVLSATLTVLEAQFINPPYPMYYGNVFVYKFYQIILNNMSIHLYEHGELEKALEIVNRGIDFAISKENMRHLPSLLSVKFKIYYYMQQYEKAKQYYMHTIYLYKIIDNNKKLAEFEEEVITDYSEILTM
jgi:transcriptional regulator with XRE-family HTH domain